MIKMICDICGSDNNANILGILKSEENYLFLTGGMLFTHPEECKHHICLDCLRKLGYCNSFNGENANNNQ